MRLQALVLTSVFFAGLILRGHAWAAEDPWQSLKFLEGTWQAQSQAGSAAAKVIGTYTFARELKGHVLSRHGEVSGCRGPQDFDCRHTDLLHIYQERPDQPLVAIYLDNEGHVIHYDVSVPQADTAEFLSPATGGPQFRLTYHLENGVMSGKFQMRAPGQVDWKSYLEWSGKQIKAT